ncbi:ABC transporter substrate-binding protein [Lachnoclostridium sp. Marseille-P6806]|uniref:ABC transporter substrate-binding protein n=1 Tax=Lachnoclostridium sp. Marseille-P6806 TaxID=2364793 RepID=UPI001030E7F0|nr:extracellular solute-binding protein [Lachnoclostridium sp. Marseille-P6806]
MKEKSKKMTALVTAGIMGLSVLTGCGASSGTGNTAETENREEQSAAGDAAAGGETTLTIWDWDSAFTKHMSEYYAQTHPGVKFEFVNVSTADYFQKLQGALSSGEGVPDIILCEMAYRGKVFDLGILDDLTKEPYGLDPAGMYDFAVDLGSDRTGTLLGLEQQVCPSGLAYRRDLAKEYFGTDDPEELEAMFSNWDAFIAGGKEVLKKSGGRVYMLPGLASCAFYILRNQDPFPYITETEIDITGRYQNDITTLAQMMEAGIIMPGDSETTIADGFVNKSFLFYPCAPWVEKWYIAANDPEGSGNWGLMAAPGGGYTYGGTSVGIYKDSPNKEAAWDYIRSVYCDGDGIREAYAKFGFMSGFRAAYGEDSIYLEPSEYDAFFGGQELGRKYKEIMEAGLKGQVQTTSEANVLTAIGVALAAYDSDPSMTPEEVLQQLIKEVRASCPDVTVK